MKCIMDIERGVQFGLSAYRTVLIGPFSSLMYVASFLEITILLCNRIVITKELRVMRSFFVLKEGLIL